jgi:hypothetical protein
MCNNIYIFVWIYSNNGLVMAGMDSVIRTIIGQYERDSGVRKMASEKRSTWQAEIETGCREA